MMSEHFKNLKIGDKVKSKYGNVIGRVGAKFHYYGYEYICLDVREYAVQDMGLYFSSVCIAADFLEKI